MLEADPSAELSPQEEKPVLEDPSAELSPQEQKHLADSLEPCEKPLLSNPAPTFPGKRGGIGGGKIRKILTPETIPPSKYFVQCSS